MNKMDKSVSQDLWSRVRTF